MVFYGQNVVFFSVSKCSTVMGPGTPAQRMSSHNQEGPRAKSPSLGPNSFQVTRAWNIASDSVSALKPSAMLWSFLFKYGSAKYPSHPSFAAGIFIRYLLCFGSKGVNSVCGDKIYQDPRPHTELTPLDKTAQGGDSFTKPRGSLKTTKRFIWRDTHVIEKLDDFDHIALRKGFSQSWREMGVLVQIFVEPSRHKSVDQRRGHRDPSNHGQIAAGNLIGFCRTACTLSSSGLKWQGVGSWSYFSHWC